MSEGLNSENNKQERPEAEKTKIMRVICAWCGKELESKESVLEEVSHGICDECLAKEMKKVKRK